MVFLNEEVDNLVISLVYNNRTLMHDLLVQNLSEKPFYNVVPLLAKDNKIVGGLTMVSNKKLEPLLFDDEKESKLFGYRILLGREQLDRYSVFLNEDEGYTLRYIYKDSNGNTWKNGQNEAVSAGEENIYSKFNATGDKVKYVFTDYYNSLYY